VPLYTYVCDDCGERLEILHATGQSRTTCGLDCQRKVVTAVHLSSGTPQLDSASIGDLHREALRRKGLRRLGGELTEGDLDRLRDKGVSVFRRDGNQRWGKDGGDPMLPAMLSPDEGEA
jgi:hypothetical protein